MPVHFQHILDHNYNLTLHVSLYRPVDLKQDARYTCNRDCNISIKHGALWLSEKQQTDDCKQKFDILLGLSDLKFYVHVSKIRLKYHCVKCRTLKAPIGS